MRFCGPHVGSPLSRGCKTRTGKSACATETCSAAQSVRCVRLSSKSEYELYGSTNVLIRFGTSPTGMTATCFLFSVSIAETDLAAELET